MSKRIIHTLAVVTEGFQQLDLDDYELTAAVTRIKGIHLFDEVADFRQGSKVTYRLSDLLFLIFYVLITEKTNSFLEMAVTIKIKQKEYEDLGLIHDGHCPSHDTLRRIMELLDGKALLETTAERFRIFLKDIERSTATGDDYCHLGVDGKEVTGTGRSDQSKDPRNNWSMLNVYDSGTATCLVSEPIEKKTNEIPTAQKLLGIMNLKKTIVTADALHCQ